MVGVHYGGPGAGVLVELAHALRAQVAVDHDGDGAPLEGPEERCREVGGVGKAHEHPLLRTDAERLEGVGEAIGAQLKLSVANFTFAGPKRCPLAHPVANAVVEEVVGDADAGRLAGRHRLRSPTRG